MDIFGYAGKTLFVDLSTGRIREEDLDRDFLELFVGGIGACARMAYDLIPPQIDPLSALNPIIIGTGPLTGTTVPASSKTIMVTKFPATHNIDGGSAGSALGPKLKLAGYDFLVIVGASEVPVYLSVRDDEVRICDASNIWGKDIYETTEELWKRHGENSTVMAIGPAGENMVKISLALVDKTHTLGKGGLGALMGGKKLKALVIDGRKGVKVYDPGKFRVITENLIGQMKRHPEHDRWVVLGRMSRFANFADIIGWPHKNCRMRCPNEITSLFGPENYVKLVMKNRVACPTCPSGCKDHVLVKEGKFAGLETYISSLYGRIMNWGSRCMVGGYNESMKCMDLCNRAGLCVHSFSALMDWAVDLYENKVINKTDTGGIELKRDFPTTLKLIDQTIRKEGFGATLAEGWLGAIKRIGRDCEKYAIQIKGVEPQFDPRSNRLGTVEFYQVTNPRGGWGSRGRSASYLQKDRPIDVTREQ